MAAFSPTSSAPTNCCRRANRHASRGFVINRFRGDFGFGRIKGLTWLRQRTGKPVLGVLPYLHGLYLDAEDALPRARSRRPNAKLRVVAPAYPRLSNHNDFDPLRFHPDVDSPVVGANDPVPYLRFDRVLSQRISSAGRPRLATRNGLGGSDQASLRYGGKLIGICGGLQMLGKQLNDPLGIEGAPGSAPGLGLMDYETTLAPGKRLEIISGTLTLPGNFPISGYRIHMGVTHGPALVRPSTTLEGKPGALIQGGQCWQQHVTVCSICRTR